MSSAEDNITSWFKKQEKVSREIFPIGIGDDMAQMRLSDNSSVLITTDMLLDGTHFDLSKHSLEQIGFKAMNVSLSDCAAMATKPVCAVAAVGLPGGFGSEKLKELHKGIVKAGDRFGCELVGGDITSWRGEGRFAINVTMLSVPVEGIEPIRRNSAKIGDIVCVTGMLGGSLAGRHIDFVPRVKEAIDLARSVKIHAMMDISDGLSSDLARICSQSGVGAVVEADKIPISDAAKKSKDPLSSALNDGEDFELLFTISEQDFERAAAAVDIEIWRVGVITDTGIMEIVFSDGTKEQLKPGGYDHL